MKTADVSELIAVNKCSNVAIQSVVLLSVLILMLAGCRQQAEPIANENVNIAVSFAPNELTIGASTVVVTLTDTAGNPINDATVNIRGDMNHAGMQPVIRDIEAGANGSYSTEYEWTMAGDWEVTVVVTLPDGTSAEQRFDYAVTGN
jgi:hypothetical protein